MQTLFACECWTNLTDGASKSIHWFLQHRNPFIISAIGLGQGVWRKTWFLVGKILFCGIREWRLLGIAGISPFLPCLLLLGNLPGKKMIFGSRKSFLWNWTAICWGFSLFALSTAARQTAAKKWFWGQENHFSRKRPRRVVLLRKALSSKTAEVMAVFQECHQRLPKFCWIGQNSTGVVLVVRRSTGVVLCSSETYRVVLE